MPWCPKCNNEYEEGTIKCPECEVDLVDELLLVEDELVLLANVKDKYEAAVIEAKLGAYEIPIIKKHKDAGAYMEVYMGMSGSGVDIYVTPDMLEQAKEIISIDVVGEIEFEDENEYCKKRRVRAWIMLLVFMPGILAIVIFVILWLISLF